MAIPVAIMLAVTVADQLSKLWITTVLAPYEIVPVIPGFFNLTRITNTGAAFGLLGSAPPSVTRVIFVAVAVVALVVLGVFAWRSRHQHRLVGIGIGLVAGGALGNLVDRVRLGAVIDFLDFFLGSYHWPAFNLADSAITVGVGCLLVVEFFVAR